MMPLNAVFASELFIMIELSDACRLFICIDL